ncbi:MAG: DedA family protein [Acidimicrobiia bacterium]
MGVVADVMAWVKDFSSSPWFYAIIFVIAVLDSILPIVPSETLVIVGGVAAGAGDLSIVGVIAAGLSGAFLGDNLSYTIGREASGWVTRRQTRTEKGRARFDRVVAQIHDRGGLLLVTARFIPGGRTLLTLSCGVTRQPRRWFVGWALVAAAIWAHYAALLGFVGGKSFEDDHTVAFLVAFSIAVGVTVVIEVARYVVARARYRRGA